MAPFSAPSPAAASARTSPAPSAGALLIAAALLAQGAGLAWLAGDAAALVAFVPLAVGGALARDRRARWPRLDVLVVTVAFGGVGMLAGAALDGSSRAGAHAAHGAGTGAGAWGAATALMLLACVPACLWMCAPLHRGGRAEHGALHLLLAVGMVAGMAVGARVLGPTLAGVMGPAAGMYAAMMLGMAAGTATCLAAFAVLGRRPAVCAPVHAHGVAES